LSQQQSTEPQTERATSDLQLWAGVECTVNRVGDRYFGQLERSGHDRRISDLDRFAELGIKALRQPVLWERVAPDGLRNADWSWSDQWLARLRELKVRPIVGLLHHGSGPRSTSLLDDDFPAKLAEYAAAVARRYPWVTDYTPVNEPLTTARFSGLYGHWYPHGKDDQSFLRALVNQCRATVLAMRAIRDVNPDARLIQTEDLGKTYSTPKLRYQADFENERRWLSIDLLLGRVNERHALWRYLEQAKAPVGHLRWLEQNPLRPDVLGFNYYLSSERFLDDDVRRYPRHLHGGNGRDAYVDVEAARLRFEGLGGARKLLREAWERDGLPLAITECHNGCTREEQLRWLAEVWQDCEELRSDKVDVRALTVWALLGSFDWNSLVARCDDWYEPGVFDLRAPQPRPTAIAHLVRKLATGEASHPVLDAPGWWRRSERFIHGGAIANSGKRLSGTAPFLTRRTPANPRPLLITGGTGTLGRAFARACVIRGLPYRLTVRSEMDIANARSVAAEFARIQPWAVINTAGYVRVDEAEADEQRCMRENANGPATLARECAKRGVKLVTFSSDLVFDGSNGAPYVESDTPNPLNAYGRSKLEAEQRVMRELASALVVRTSAFFGPWDQHNFVTIALRELAAKRNFQAANDVFVSPTYVPHLVNAVLDLMLDDERGIWHVANAGAVSWYELARCAAELASIPTDSLIGVPGSTLGLPAPRPRYSALTSEKGWIMPTLQNALERYMEDCEVPAAEEPKAA
jgi:dTDP-4-dehydrorhamnose reductase